MPPRTGRPPKENPKDIRIQIRLDKEELQKLDECVKREASTRSEIVRKEAGKSILPDLLGKIKEETLQNVLDFRVTRCYNQLTVTQKEVKDVSENGKTHRRPQNP